MVIDQDQLKTMKFLGTKPCDPAAPVSMRHEIAFGFADGRTTDSLPQAALVVHWTGLERLCADEELLEKLKAETGSPWGVYGMGSACFHKDIFVAQSMDGVGLLDNAETKNNLLSLFGTIVCGAMGVPMPVAVHLPNDGERKTANAVWVDFIFCVSTTEEIWNRMYMLKVSELELATKYYNKVSNIAAPVDASDLSLSRNLN